jgi:hypothetical protein
MSQIRQAGVLMPTSLRGIANKASSDKHHRFRNLFGLLTVAFLLSCWKRVNKKAASGVDRVSARCYARTLVDNVGDLWDRVKRGSYRARLVRRCHIPKAGGKTTRPLGIPVVEDKLLQIAVSRILNAIYEPIFLPCSWAYRIGRSAREAVRTLKQELQFGCSGICAGGAPASLPRLAGRFMKVDSEALDRIRVVAEDITYLRREWSQDVDDASLRISSPILRRLLVDGLLQRVWRDLGLDKQPIVSAPSLEVMLKPFPIRKITYAQAGGAKHQGIVVTSVVEYGDYLSPDQAMKAFGSGPNAPDRDFSLRRFLEGTCIVVNSAQISRHTLVKYIANKLGGVHLDFGRNLTKDEERKFALLDKVRAERGTANRPAIYYEYLSVGQALINSADIDRFLAIAGNAVQG